MVEEDGKIWRAVVKSSAVTGTARTPVAFFTERYEIGTMNGTDFVRRARRYARKVGKPFRFDPRHGKGSHGVLYVGDRRTTVKHGELKPGAFQSMLKQLDIPKEDF